MTPAMEQFLTKLAARAITSREDLFGESPDDAYERGEMDGETWLAKHLLKEFAQ